MSFLTRLRQSFMGIRGTLFGALMALTVVQMTSSALRIGQAWQDFRTAQRIESVNDTTNDLLRAAHNFALERGRTAVALRGSGPVTAENRGFIALRRMEAGVAIAAALQRLPDHGIAGTEPLVAALREALAALDALRREVDRDLALALAQRDRGLPDRWFQAASAVVHAIGDLMADLSGEISALDGVVARLSAIKLNAWDMRDQAGRESARLGAAVASGAPLAGPQLADIADLQVRTMLHWTSLRRAATGSSDPGSPRPWPRSNGSITAASRLCAPRCCRPPATAAPIP